MREPLVFPLALAFAGISAAFSPSSAALEFRSFESLRRAQPRAVVKSAPPGLRGFRFSRLASPAALKPLPAAQVPGRDLIEARPLNESQTLPKDSARQDLARAAGQAAASREFAAVSGAVFDGSRETPAAVRGPFTPTLADLRYGHGLRYFVLRAQGRIEPHRKGLFKNRVEKLRAYASVPAAAAVTAFVGIRYLTEFLPSALSDALGIVGQYYLNDFLSPIGLAAAGYLIALGVCLRQYKKTPADERDGALTRTAAIVLPLIAMAGGMAHEAMQSELFKAVAGFGMPGSFQAGDFAAYAAGGLASLLLTALLWRPYANRTGPRALGLSVAIAFAAAAFFILCKAVAGLSLGAGVAVVVGASLFGGAKLLQSIRSLHGNP